MTALIDIGAPAGRPTGPRGAAPTSRVVDSPALDAGASSATRPTPASVPFADLVLPAANPAPRARDDGGDGADRTSTGRDGRRGHQHPGSDLPTTDAAALATALGSLLGVPIPYRDDATTGAHRTPGPSGDVAADEAHVAIGAIGHTGRSHGAAKTGPSHPGVPERPPTQPAARATGTPFDGHVPLDGGSDGPSPARAEGHPQRHDAAASGSLPPSAVATPTAVATPSAVAIPAAVAIPSAVAIPAAVAIPSADAATAATAGPRVPLAVHAAASHTATPSPAPAATVVPAPSATLPPPMPAAPAVLQPALSGALARLHDRADGTYQLRVSVHPADLGVVNVVATVSHGSIAVVLSCPEHGARAVLGDALPQLRQQLVDTGFAGVDVGLGAPQQEQRQPAAPGRRTPSPTTAHHHPVDAVASAPVTRTTASRAALDRWL